MSDFLNTPTAGDRWRFPVQSPGHPMRAIGSVQAPDVVTGHQQQAAALIADWLQDGGTARAVDRLANILAQHDAELAERDAAAASLHDADQATITRLATRVAVLEEFSGAPPIKELDAEVRRRLGMAAPDAMSTEVTK